MAAADSFAGGDAATAASFAIPGVGWAVGGASLFSGLLGAFGKQDPKFDMSAPLVDAAPPPEVMRAVNALRSNGNDNLADNMLSNWRAQAQQQQDQAYRGSLFQLERGGLNAATSGLAGFQGALGNEVAMGSQASLDYANLLGDYSKGGFLPGEGDIKTANELADKLFAARKVAQTQAFSDQLTQANRQAALSGRGVNDPILKAKLAQEQTRQGDLLNAEQGSFSAQFAQSLPFQRAQFAGQRADVLNQRGQQALGNQLQLAQLGSGLQQQLWSQRFNQAAAQMQAQMGSSSTAERIGSALNAGVSGLGVGMSMASAWQSANRPWAMPQPSAINVNLGGGSTAAGSAPTAPRSPGGAPASWATPWQPSYSPFVSAPNYVTPFNQGPAPQQGGALGRMYW